jgi:ParB family transcriptional regulator, chromosome partitioning protein
MSPTSTLSKKASSPVPRRVKPGSTVSTETPPLTRVGGSSDVEQQVVMISIDKLHRHPKNRVIDPTSLADLVQSLQEHGQREPIRVRPLPDPIGHYEIISGERRYLSALRCEPPVESLKAIIETSGDAAALIDLAVANAAREDLDPIQRAELMIELMLPIDKGGAGMDKAAAGRVFGLNSESGVKNALRLLNLPQFFRDLLQSKQVPVNKVRPLCAYPKGLLEHFAKWLQVKDKKWRMDNFLQPMRDEDHGIDDEILDFIEDATRTCDQVKQSLGYQVGDWPCLFDVAELSEKQRAELQVFEIPHRERWQSKLPADATRLVALNVKLWHKLQDPLIKQAKEQQKSKGSKAKATAAVKGEAAAKPTAAELKAKRKKADDQLEHYTREWIVRALRYHLSEISLWCNDAYHVMRLLPWLLASSYDKSQMDRWNEWALVDTASDSSQSGKRKGNCSAVEFVGRMPMHSTFYDSLWRVVLWPACRGNYGHDDLAPAGTIPERMPGFSGRVIHELAEACGVSIETVWHASAKDSMQRALVKQWLMRHNKEQLQDLAKSLGSYIGNGKREDMVDELLSYHAATPGKKAVLKLPPMISKLVGKKGGAK